MNTEALRVFQSPLWQTNAALVRKPGAMMRRRLAAHQPQERAIRPSGSVFDD